MYLEESIVAYTSALLDKKIISRGVVKLQSGKAIM